MQAEEADQSILVPVLCSVFTLRYAFLTEHRQIQGVGLFDIMGNKQLPANQVCRFAGSFKLLQGSYMEIISLPLAFTHA